MANENDGSPHNDALAALHGGEEEVAHEVHAEEHQVAEEVAEAVDDAAAPSASGFVGMLAKGNGTSDDPAPTRPSNPVGPSSRPTPQPQQSRPESKISSPRAAGTEQIRMAVEIVMPEAAVEEPAPVAAPAKPAAPARTPARTSARLPKVPGWYHAAVPVMFTVSSLLMVIGFWALGAVVAVLAKLDSYPLLQHAEDYDTGLPVWSKTSKVMAFGMLIALPVAASLIVMAMIMQKQIRAAARAAEKAAAAKAEQKKDQ